MYFWRHNHLYLWNYLQLDLLPTWFEQLQHNWSLKFDLHLVSSPRTSQSSQFSDLMPSSTIHLASPSQKASNQRSQLEHPSYFSNPSPMDERNKLSLYLDTFSLPTPTKGRWRQWRGIKKHPLLHHSPQPLPPHINTHPLIHMLHIFYQPLPLPPLSWPSLLLCINEVSINQ